MFYESHGIQQEGWIIEVGEKTIGQQCEHGKGQSRKAGKNQSWKHRSICQNCGTLFAGRPGAANRFCKNDCQHEFSVKRWFTCSCCLAKVGLGANTSAKLLGVTRGNINRQWKKLGIVAQRPQNGSWFQTIRKQQTAKAEEEARLWRIYESAWMSDIKQAGKGFDWSYLWYKRKSLDAMRERYRAMTPTEKKEWNRMSSARNPERRKKYLSNWKAEKRSSDPIYRMIESFRARLCLIAKGKESKTKDLIGCEVNQFKKHIESQFKRGMTWENYGTIWHVDHILPVSSFDHNNPKHVAQCWHWTNLRPLAAKKNLEKGASITQPQMSLMLCASH